MSITHTITKTYKDASGAAISGSLVVINDTEINYDSTLSKTAANLELDIAVTRANLKAFCMYSDLAVTVKTNTTGGTDTILVPAGQVVIWSLAADGLTACPFSVDVTKLYLTVTGSPTVDGVFKFRAVLDQSV